MRLRSPSLRRVLASLPVAWLSIASAATASPSPRPAARPEETAARPATAVRPVRYDLDFKLNFADSRIACSGRLTVRNSGDTAAPVVPLLFYRLLKVTSLRDASSGAEVPRTQAIVGFEDWEELQVNFVEVRPAAPLAPGASLALDIAYEGMIAGYTEAMGYVRDRVDPEFTMLRAETYAYPQVGVPSWKANRSMGLPPFDYALRITVPKTHAAVNLGRAAGRRETGAGSVYEFANIKPAWRMDLAVAPYETLEDAPRGLKVHHFPKDRDGAKRVLSGLSDVMALLAGWFGPLPGAPAFTVIEVPEGYGSQSDVSGILLTRDAFNDPARMPDLYHEISHFWNADSRDPLPPRYETEGLAMFLQALVSEARDKSAGAIAATAERCRKSFRRDCAAHPEHAKVAMADYGKADITDLSYTKGMIFFTLLHRAMGQRDFLETMGAFARRYRESGASAAEFERFVKTSSKVPLDAIFADWVDGAASSELLLGPRSLEEIFAVYAPAKPPDGPGAPI